MNPFHTDVHSAGDLSAEGVHEETLAALRDHVERLGPGVGKIITLTASRAGLGKSHLLSRLRAAERARAFFVPLHFQPPSGKGLLGDLVDALRAEPDYLLASARFYLSQLMILGIRKDLIEVAAPESAPAYITDHFMTLLEEGHPRSRAAWFKLQFPRLLSSLADPLAASFQVRPLAARFWAERFHELSQGAPFPTAGELELPASLNPRDAAHGLAIIVSALRPLVFLADGLDRFHGDQEAGRRIASLLTEWADAIPRSLTVLSLNQELWNSTFADSIPSAMEDRLKWDELELTALSLLEEKALLEHRLSLAGYGPAVTSDFLATLELGSGGETPRHLLRAARRQWELYSKAGLPADARDSVPVREAAPATIKPLAEMFHELRLRYLEPHPAAFDAQRLRSLLTAVGNHFPTIRQEAVSLPREMHDQAISWSTQNREIYVGFAAPSSETFWRELLRVAKHRTQAQDRPSHVKAVVFSPKAEPAPLELLVHTAHRQEVRNLLDPLEVDGELLASLYAAEDLVRDVKSGVLALTNGQVYGFIASELDYFWRRLTRTILSAPSAAPA